MGSDDHIESQRARSNRCATRYPVVLTHGMGLQARIMGIIDYWGDIPGALRENGADVHISRVNAMDSHEKKGALWKEQVLQILHATGKSKVNVVGHSDGCLYSRYAISNLGLGPAVASHTSMGGPHRGSCIADMFMGSIPDTVKPVVGGGLDWASAFVMGDVSPDSIANGFEMTRAYMGSEFNPGNPDMPGVYYQSYAYRVTTAAGAGLLCPTWIAMLPIEGDNDGLVSVASARWGEFQGVIDGGAWWLFGGVNHFSAVGLHPLASPGYHPAAHFVDVVSDLRDKGF
jgi:triacylglycerol lipase